MPARGTPRKRSARRPTPVALAAADYILGGPSFETPALAQTHQLAANDYLLRPPAFDAPSGKYDGWVRWGGRPGRPRRSISADAEATMVAALEIYLRQRQAASCRRILRSDLEVKAYVLTLASNAGVRVGYERLRRTVIKAAFDNLRRPPTP